MRHKHHTFLARVSGLVLIGAALGLVPGPAAGARGNQDGALPVGRQTRTYHIHLPAAAAAHASLPLVLVFHGGGGTGAGAARWYGFDQLADAQSFAVVYPEGLRRHWNDGRGVTEEPWLNTTLEDDLGFVSALIDRLTATLPIDPRRIYATGISNGGIFSQLLACELSNKIAAIGPVAGTMARNEAPRCRPARPVSVIEFHGTDDRFVPYAGGDILGQSRRGSVLSVVETGALWARLDGCRTTGGPAELSVAVQDDPTRVRWLRYSACRLGTEVGIYTIAGGGHTWPGTRWFPLLGPVSGQINATQTMWAFFARHSQR